MIRTLAICAMLALSACATPQMNEDGTPPDRTACGPELPGTGAGKAVTGAVVGFGTAVLTGPVGAAVLIGKEIAQSDCREKVKNLRQAYFEAQCSIQWHPICETAFGIGKPPGFVYVRDTPLPTATRVAGRK